TSHRVAQLCGEDRCRALADTPRLAARADPLEVGGPLEDRPVELGQVLGNRGPGLDGFGEGWGRPGLHHAARSRTATRERIGRMAQARGGEVPDDRDTVL